MNDPAPGPWRELVALREHLRGHGAAPLHEAHLLRRWLHALPLDGGKRRAEDFLPAPLRAALPALESGLDALLAIESEHPAPDGSARLLLRLHDGQAIEAVRLPRSEGLCVSSQVGCAVACRFCMTGQGGLQRQLGSAEIVAQVALARRARAVHKVVFMGMGEPAHNLEAVLEAIELLGTAGGIGHKNLVFSTVGDPRAFARLAALRKGQVRPALALSLHSTDAAKRAELLPKAPRLAPEELVGFGEHYARSTGYPIQYQWTLLAGVNDGDDEIDGIARLLAGRYAVMNLIPYNSVPGLPYARPAIERAAEMARTLHRRGVLTKLRHSAGQEVDAGCGQLRSRSLEARGKVVPVVAA